MSLNLDDEYGYYTTTRDFGVFDTSPKDVAAITPVFDGDYAHRPIKPSDGTDLVWSPGSQPRMLPSSTALERPSRSRTRRWTTPLSRAPSWLLPAVA